MDHSRSEDWLGLLRNTVASYREMIDRTIEQLSDDELFARPAPGMNSVAIVLRHLGGNLQSRWTDFLTTDGEKSSRNRDTEFEDWDGDRESLLRFFNQGWNALTTALDSINDGNVGNVIEIRGEPHSIPQALVRSITHLTYHVGQIAMTARMVHRGNWNWLTVAPNESKQHNERTWGTAESRSVFSKGDDVR
ncbi:MAG: DUF1572 family protein [Planctomicrobium sp.]|jgi:uncharacterized damage-inducible protein DinB|nr:DUF1572 family protein [Planctomicrobium sp.]